MGTFPDSLPDWANLDVLHQNTLSPRSDFHLYDDEESALSRDVYTARTINLSGAWKFSLAKSPFDAPTGFEQPSFDCSKWSNISVPGVWQLQGFGRGPQYTNVQFPFFVDPPHPPYAENECGSYITQFDVPERLQNDQLRLRFEGVDSALHVWVNGRQVGYSQGSRNPSEFDITEFVNKADKNVLAVQVYQFCDGSYIEDQDQWWLSGVFRDVYLLAFPQKSRLEDINIQTLLDEEYRDAILQVRLIASGAKSVYLKLLDASKNEVTTASNEANAHSKETLNFSIPISNPEKWTAETPYLYTLVVAIDSKVFTAHRVGFRRIELKAGLIMVNGKRVVFKGANRHEHHPRFGRAVPHDFMKQDLLLMKRHNINAIRTSHQPSDTRLYDLADELGFWVMDEADLECHGFETIEDAALDPAQRDLPFFERQQLTRAKAAKWTSDKPEWREAYLDRARQVVCRDRLHPSVVIWSLGNESFYGRNHTAMVEWIRENDPTRLVHYEPDLEAEAVDMHSRMYPSIESIVKFGEDQSKTKPLVLCEYIHAMGTGPGNIKEYIDAFHKYPKLQGGFVWEWANHGLLTYNKDGEPFYGYGGDFADVPNDYNFVLDGVLNSDHTPNSGLLEYKKALEPVQLISANAEHATIINRQDFATLDDLVCTYSVVCEDGTGGDGGYIEIPEGIHPGQVAELLLPKVELNSSVETMLQLSFSPKKKTMWAHAGYELATAQIPLTSLPSVAEPDNNTTSALSVKREAKVLSISGTLCQWTFNLLEGKLTSWNKNGDELLAAPLEPSFLRAPTDNDAPQDGAEWRDRKLHLAKLHNRSVSWHQKDDQVIITAHQKSAPPVLSWSLDLETQYIFTPTGTLKILVKGTPQGKNLPQTLPRIGLTLGVSRTFQEISWFGRGPGESYRDMKHSQLVGLHTSPIDSLWSKPEFPQECSNRTDTRWLRITSHESNDTTFTAQFFEPEDHSKRHLFDFMASHFDVQDVDEAQHPLELERRRKEDVVLRLDAEHHGLGTGSCGPKTLEEYRLGMRGFEFGVLLY